MDERLLNQPFTPAGGGATAVLALASGDLYFGVGVGAVGEAVGEVCFNTAMTGYQEILSDPSYADQIVTFTFPHVGNVGTNPRDEESVSPAAATAARGTVLRAAPTPASNWRAAVDLNEWLARRGVIGVAGVDTRALTRRIREHGMPHAVIAHHPDGVFDAPALVARAQAWAGIAGAELARRVTAERPYDSDVTPWGDEATEPARFKVVVMDFGVKRGILARLRAIGADVIVAPADSPVADILALKPDGVLLANGPGDPAATAGYAASEIRALLRADIPVFGICLGHQLLALAAGARTVKMEFGHHGANHPVKDLATGRVEIVSMNHGFTVDAATLPAGVTQTHVSLFDGSNCGLSIADARAFSLQHHPEASPGPHDAFGAFDRFATMMAEAAA